MTSGRGAPVETADLSGISTGRLDLRIQLVGYLMQRHFKDKSLAIKRARHILWLIENVPDHPVLAEPEAQILNINENYTKAKTLLLAKLEWSKTPTIYS